MKTIEHEHTDAGKGDGSRVNDTAAYKANYERIFGHAEHTIAPGGETIVVGHASGELVHDNPERSMAFACPDPAKQVQRLQYYEKCGIMGLKYHPRTGELIYPRKSRGLHLQKRVAAVHGLEVCG